MAEATAAIALASSIVTLVSAVGKSSQMLYNTIQAIKNAPKHISKISSDLQDFHHVLGILQALVSDDDDVAGVIRPESLANLEQVLKECLKIFQDMSRVVDDYVSHGSASVGTSPWQRLKLTFKEKEIRNLIEESMSCKVTLNLAIAVANL